VLTNVGMICFLFVAPAMLVCILCTDIQVTFEVTKHKAFTAD